MVGEGSAIGGKRHSGSRAPAEAAQITPLGPGRASGAASTTTGVGVRRARSVVRRSRHYSERVTPEGSWAVALGALLTALPGGVNSLLVPDLSTSQVPDAQVVCFVLG